VAAAKPAPDLFGAVDTAGSEAEAVAAADQPLTAEAKPVGARNENSVLFSLDALKAGVEPTQEPPKRAPAPSPIGSSSSDGMSAIMNIGAGGALFDPNANQALLNAPPPPEPPKEKPKPKVEEPVVASMATPPQKKGPNMVVVVGGSVLATLLIVGVVVAVVLGGGKDDDATAKNEPVAETTQSNEGAESDSEKPTTKADETDEGSDESASTDESQDEEAADETAEEDPEEPKGKDGKPPTPEELAAFKKAAAEKKKREEAAKKDKKDDAKKDEPKKDLGSFSKSAAIASLGAAAAQAAACKKPDGPSGTGRATVTFAPSGRVTSANVSGGGFGGTATGGCVASIFRRARVPPFSGGSVTVSKSFTIP
jgi:hypothetical protein